MADYNSMKVPELKKLLTERSLPHTGNKADLIARLTEDDKQKAAASAAPQAGKLLRHPPASKQLFQVTGIGSNLLRRPPVVAATPN